MNIVSDMSLLVGGASANKAAAAVNAKPATNEAIDKAAKDFESVFLAQMMTHMFEGVGEDTLGGEQNGDDVYKSWMVEQYGKLISDSGGIGIADYVRAEMLKLQEIKDGAQSADNTIQQGLGL